MKQLFILPRVRQFRAKDSSVIEEVAYISNRKLACTFVTFKSGDTYMYKQTPFKVYKSLRRAQFFGKSVGRRFNKILKWNYEYSKVPKERP
jgi:hypothetical protein|tara:strand:- start:433 stop:705 length:273 start_codon:yes stop_codon:yes gene_type:complete